LDYFAALDVAAAEASPHAADAPDVPGPSTGRRRRRAVAKRRVSAEEGARLRVSKVGRQELLTVVFAGRREHRGRGTAKSFCG
jgi:IS5 family transposase